MTDMKQIASLFASIRECQPAVHRAGHGWQCAARVVRSAKNIEALSRQQEVELAEGTILSSSSSSQALSSLATHFSI